MIRVELTRILINEEGSEQMIFLKESDGSRAFPIVIGVVEAHSIDMAVKGQSFIRPLTHDLICRVIQGLGAELKRAVVKELTGGTFYADLILSLNGTEVSVDCRPSDAVAVAVRLDAPMFVEDSVFGLVELPDPEEEADPDAADPDEEIEEEDETTG